MCDGRAAYVRIGSLDWKGKGNAPGAVLAEMDAVIAWKSGTIVDATIIAAPSSTKNAAKARGVRYRGLAKNLARAYTVFALANLYSVRRELLPAGMPCVL